ncbi:hypothetical protein [uncultured Roseibium sp.]
MTYPATTAAIVGMTAAWFVLVAGFVKSHPLQDSIARSLSAIRLSVRAD